MAFAFVKYIISKILSIPSRNHLQKKRDTKWDHFLNKNSTNLTRKQSVFTQHTSSFYQRYSLQVMSVYFGELSSSANNYSIHVL